MLQLVARLLAEAVVERAAAGAADLGETAASLRAAIAGLGDSYRRAVQLRFVEGLSVEEAAARLGRTPGALLVLCSRAVKLLRRQIEGREPENDRPIAA